LLQNAVKNLASQLVVADLARRFFKGFDEADRAAAAVRTLGVDSKTLQTRLLGVSNRLGGLYSQTQLVTAAYDVASSGFTDAADAAKVLEAAAKGATGGLSDINTVGNAVTSVLNAYGKSANDAAILVDGFIQTQNDGKIVLNEYAQQIGKLAPTAAATGVGINELNAAISTITAQGVPVEATFTGLNQALVSILKPSKEASDLAKALGIDFSETGLRANGFGGLLKEVKEKTGGSTTALVKLFGSVDALKAVLPLVNDDLVKYNKNVERQANVSGVADKATQELGGTVSSEITKMVNQIGNLARSLDVVLGPALGGILKLINFVIGQAAQGILVLGQLFSMTPGKQLAFEAVQSGNLGAAARVLPGIDETIGEKRRKDLQQQAGAGTGFMGMGMDQSKFIKLLQQQPEFKVPATAGNKPAAVVDPALQALLDKLAAGGGGGKGKNDAERKAEEKRRAAEELANLQGQVTLKEKLFGIDKQIAVEKERGSLVTAAALEMDKALEERQSRIAEITRSTADTATKNAQIKDATLDADQKIYAVQQAIKEQEAERTKLFNEIIADLDLQLALKTATTEQEREQLRIAAERAKLEAQLKGLPQPQIDQITGLQAQVAAPLTDVQKIDQHIGKLKTEIADLTSLSNIAITSAEGIGNAFAQSFQGLISGTMTAKEALGSFFKSVADMFLEMAAKIIAKQITMIILQTILKALGAVAGAGGGGAELSSGFDAGSASALPTDSAGWSQSFATKLPGRAVGGPVTSQQPYMVGERGPELFVPGTGGSVVNNSDLRSAMNGGSGGASGSPVLNMSFQSTSINGVEYVSREQLESAMAETRRNATRDGAKRGMTMTLDRIQNSSSTRRKVGI
jgi:TP901 family phage tail tape measure protein